MQFLISFIVLVTRFSPHDCRME